MKTLDEGKYESGGLVKRYLLHEFRESVRRMTADLRPVRVIDIGCGEGHLTEALGPPYPHLSLDLSLDSLRRAKRRLPTARFAAGDIRALPFRPSRETLFLCLEVFEHLEAPEEVLQRMSEALEGKFLISVPREPHFTLASLLAGKHLSRWGRHPGHINAWSGREFEEFLARRLVVERKAFPFPFSLFLCSTREGAR